MIPSMVSYPCPKKQKQNIHIKITTCLCKRGCPIPCCFFTFGHNYLVPFTEKQALKIGKYNATFEWRKATTDQFILSV